MTKLLFENKRQFGENLYYCTFVYALVLSFLLTSNYVFLLSSHVLHWFIYISIAILFIKTFGIDKNNRQEFVFKVIVYLITIISWRLVRNIDILLCISFILGAKDVKFRKIITLFFGTIGILLVGTVILSQADIVKDGIYIRDHFQRHSLGIVYPTDMAAYVFYLVLAYCYLLFGRLTWRSYLLITLLDVVLYNLTQARTSFALILLTIPTMWIAQRAKDNHKISRGIASFFWGIAPLSAYLTLMLSWLYSKGNKCFDFVNRLLSNRLWLSHKALNKYGLSLFGQHVVERGFGGRKGLRQFYHPKLNYFYIDSSYVRLAVIYGVVLGILIIAVMTIIAYRSVLRREFSLATIIMLISLHCIIEQHLIDISYDPFLMAFLATLPLNNKMKNLGGKYDGE